jgi:hypothetical protein
MADVVIGPTFGQELIAAGLGGCSASWMENGTFYNRELLTDEQNIKLDEVIAAHDPTKPPPPTILDRLEARVEQLSAEVEELKGKRRKKD